MIRFSVTTLALLLTAAFAAPALADDGRVPVTAPTVFMIGDRPGVDWPVTLTWSDLDQCYRNDLVLVYADGWSLTFVPGLPTPDGYWNGGTVTWRQPGADDLPGREAVQVLALATPAATAYAPVGGWLWADETWGPSPGWGAVAFQVPEPASLAVLAAGLAVLARRRAR